MINLITKFTAYFKRCTDENAIKSPMTKNEAIDLFKKEPNLYFKGYGSDNYSWPQKNDIPLLDRMYIRVGKFSIGWIQNINLNLEQREVTIGHFAIDSSLKKLGLGRILANALKQELIARYNIKTIIFRENHSDSLQPYNDFFKSIGAKQFPTKEHRTREWHWDIT